MESPRTIKGWATKYRIGTAIRRAMRMIFTNSHVSQKNLANAGFTPPPPSSGDASGRAPGSCSLIYLSIDVPAPCIMCSPIKARNALCANIAHFFHTCNGRALNTDKGLLRRKKRADVSRREWIRVIVVFYPQEANQHLPAPSWREDAVMFRVFFYLTVRTGRFFPPVLASCRHPQDARSHPKPH